jgi:hypothetical protein
MPLQSPSSTGGPLARDAGPTDALTDADGNFAFDVISGLSAKEKKLLPTYFYDAAGSRLFQEICKTPEYYVTRSTAQRNQFLRLRRHVVERSLHRFINVAAVGSSLIQRWAREQASCCPRDALAFGLIVAVEQEWEPRIEGAIAGDKVGQHECFEEPCRVRQVSFGR